jgi:hypothetical protein
MSEPRFLHANLLTDSGATLTASAEDVGYPVENLATWRLDETWRASGANSYTVAVEFAAEQAATAFALSNHNLKTCNARVKIDGYDPDDSAPSYTPIMAYVTPVDDKTLARFFAASYKGFLITIDNNGGANFSPEIGIAFIGTYFQMEHSPDVPSDADELEDVAERERSGTGYNLGSTLLYTKRKQSWSFSHLTPSWYTTYFLPFWVAYRRLPVISVWNSETYPLEAYLMTFVNDALSGPYQSVLHRALTLSLEGVME